MKTMCEKGFNLALVEQLINLSKFEEEVRRKLNDEVAKFEKTLKGIFLVILAISNNII